MKKNKYSRPRKRNIDKKEIEPFLTSIEFEIKEITQEWRHLTAFGKYNGKEAVFKLASTLTTSPYTRNEHNWNDAIHSIPINKHPNFTVPKNFLKGEYKNLFYFVAQKFMGQVFAKLNSPISSSVARRIPQIAKLTREIELLSIPANLEFSQTHQNVQKTKTPVYERLLASATEWASKVPKELDPFLRVIEKTKGQLKTCPVHGDFVIRQMYDEGEIIGIIDGEHAGLEYVYHYDVAQFYIRLRNDHNAKELANQYLIEFYNLLPSSEKETFWEELKPPLTQRYIGDLWGAAKNPSKLDELESLGREILENRILD